MQPIALLLSAAAVLAASSAVADSRVFIIANQPDGYGVDRCLAGGDTCGASAALTYCRSREFTKATAFRRVDPDEITGSIPRPAAGKSVREDYVAITCQR